jgi:hypothetical protein
VFSQPRSIGFDPANNRIIVGDTALDALIATGDRRLIGDVSQAITGLISGLALDEDGGRLFVSGHDAIVEVDLESEAVQTIASTALTVLGEVRGLELDIDNDRLLVGDPVNALMQIDRETGELVIISK